jgi:hypothetical protein
MKTSEELTNIYSNFPEVAKKQIRYFITRSRSKGVQLVSLFEKDESEEHKMSMISKLLIISIDNELENHFPSVLEPVKGSELHNDTMYLLACCLGQEDIVEAYNNRINYRRNLRKTIKNLLKLRK